MRKNEVRMFVVVMAALVCASAFGAPWIARDDQAVPAALSEYNVDSQEKQDAFYKTINETFWDRSSVRLPRQRNAASGGQRTEDIGQRPGTEDKRLAKFHCPPPPHLYFLS